MQEYFKKHQHIIMRIAGASVLLVTLVIHFWSAPKEGASEAKVAAANVARMEASVVGSGVQSKTKSPEKAPLMQKYIEEKEKQFEYLSLLAMLFGGGFFLYSFVKKETPQE